jgi:hypothetical protein
MIRVDPSKMQTRRACNRCHQAKLKCVVEGNRKCQRCRRANSECTFSPPTRMQRQHTSPRSPPPPSFNSQEYQLNCWSDINLDWNLPVESSLLTTTGFDNSTQAGVEFPTSAQCSASIDYDNSSHIHDPASHLANYAELLMPSTLFGTSSSGTANETSDVGSGMFPGYVGAEGSRLNTASSYEAEGNEATAAGTLPSPESEDEHPSDLAFWANQITQLFVQFTQHLQSIPQINPDSHHRGSSKDRIPRPSKLHDSDHTFGLSESFINVLGGMCSKLPPSISSRAAEDWSTNYLILDEASYLLIISTYLRFLEMHDTVFRYLLACLSHEIESTGTGSCFYLPKLIIGSFSLAMTSETRPLLFVNLMESMLARAKHLFHHLASTRTESVRRDSTECFGELSPIVEPNYSLQAVQARESSIATLVERIKTRLSRSKSFKR